jgi:hypothetical protein
MARPIIDISGKKYDRLMVIGLDSIKNRTTYWRCKCDCGNEKIINKNSLISGHTKSCGCHYKDNRRNWLPIEENDYLLIPLTQNKFTKIDKDDFDIIKQYTWTYHSIHGLEYATTNHSIFNDKKRMEMHRLIMNQYIKNQNIKVDHISRNGLDNRKLNLRICTHDKNIINSKKRINTISKYKGVTKRLNVWRARITVNGKLTQLGDFLNEIDAAIAYDDAARKFHKEFARINFPNNGENGCLC